MALFEEHLGWALGGGIILAAAGVYARHLQPIEGVFVIALAAIGGTIADVDTEQSKAFRYITVFLGIIIPIPVFYRFNPQVGPDFLTKIFFYFFIGALSYLVICLVLKKLTTPRGVMHSIPFALLCAEVTYLLFISDFDLFASASEKMPIYFAAAVFIGYITHLLADELHALTWDGEKKKLIKNKMFGTAFTMYTNSKVHPVSTAWANIILYLMVVVFFFAIKSQEVSLQSLWTLLINAT